MIDRYCTCMYLVFNVFYFYSGVGQKDSGVGRAHLPPPPFAKPLPVACQNEILNTMFVLTVLGYKFSFKVNQVTN
jgi:hypothetical protein